MRQIQMTEMQSIETLSIHKCKYCDRELPNEFQRVEVFDLRSGRILYVFCQTDHCMSAHISDFYHIKNTHMCYNNACMEFVR